MAFREAIAFFTYCIYCHPNPNVLILLGSIMKEWRAFFCLLRRLFLNTAKAFNFLLVRHYIFHHSVFMMKILFRCSMKGKRL